MSSQTPNKIYESFKNNILDETRASELLISLIENGPDKNYRIQVLSLKLLGLIGSNKNFVFNFLENLLISDLDEYIRGNAASFIITNFPDKARKPLLWALKHEKSSISLILIIKALEKTSIPRLKSLLKLKNYVNFEGNIFFPSEIYQILNLNSKNIDNIADIEKLENLTKLRKLYLNFNKITDINGLDNLSDLRSLHLQSNKINGINSLDNLKKLEFLYLNNNEITEIKGIKHCSNLRFLQLFDNKISKIKGLEKLHKLEVLNLRNNEINNISGLEYLINLKRLDLSNNRIFKIKGLKNLSKLEFLDLSYNKINEIEGLDYLKNLRFLDLRHNNITEIKGLEKLKNLQHLYLGFNSIKEDYKTGFFKYLKIQDIKNTTNVNVPDSLGEVYSHKEIDRELLNKQLQDFKDIKFISSSFNSILLFKELNSITNPLNYFTDSSWIVIWRSNEYEIFRLSRLGKIIWSQTRNFRKLKNQ